MEMNLLETLKTRSNEMMLGADPRTKHWFLVSNSPFPMVTVLALYVVAVCVGPRLMKNRRPFDMKNILIAYNICLVFLSLYMFIEFLSSCYHADYNFICDPYVDSTKNNPKEMRVAKIIWIFYFSKYLELFDTISMILRKKNSQITFLHVYHHVLTNSLMWMVTAFIPGGGVYFPCFLNCGVHVIMYTYYGLSAIPSCRWIVYKWKQYLTKIQMVQFAMNMSFTVLNWAVGCQHGDGLKAILFFFEGSLLVLFANFYIQSYRKKTEGSRNDSPYNKNKHI